MAVAMATNSSASAVLSAIADRTEQIMQQQREDTHTGMLSLPSRVDGRVFRRLHQFAQLPPEIKAHADAVAVYLGSANIVDAVFSKRYWPRMRGRAIGPTVRGHVLVAEILKYLVNSRAVNASEQTAKQLAETLVLSGFISPVNEPENEPTDMETTSQEPGKTITYIQPRELYELVSSAMLRTIRSEQRPDQFQAERLESGTSAKQPTAPDQQTFSVWDVVDGATRAGNVFRKQPPSVLHSLLASLSFCHHGPPQGHEKEYYVVVNRVQHKAVFVFADDVARQETARVPLRDAMVQYELGSRDAPMYHGLKLWTDDLTERFDFMTRDEQHEWLLSLLDGGARFKETHRHIREIIARPFYTQRDVTASGTEFTMGDLVRGKVVVLVNTASKDPEAALQIPELVTLWDQYHGDGLAIVACPSDQFLALEFANDHEIITHMQHVYGVRFRILSKRDVNGSDAREPFLYCNAHLPGAFGPFTEWNFTKFLLDRSGKPYRRYATSVLPHEMEGDIRRLLGLRRRQIPIPTEAEQVVEQLEPERVANEIEHATCCHFPGCSCGPCTRD